MSVTCSSILQDWLTYRDDRLKELAEESEAIKSNYIWNKAHYNPSGSMDLMDRLKTGKDALDARVGLRIPVPGEGRQPMDGAADQGQEVGSVS